MSDGTNDTVRVAQFPKNGREVVICDVGTWKDRPIGTIRVWFPKDGELRPSREGFALATHKLKQLRDGVDAMIQEAERRGWSVDEEKEHRSATTSTTTIERVSQ